MKSPSNPEMRGIGQQTTDLETAALGDPAGSGDLD